MAIGKKKKGEDPTEDELSKEFFGDANSANVPGQDVRVEGTTNLFSAIVGSKVPGADQELQEDNYSLFDESGTKTDYGPDYVRGSWFHLDSDDSMYNPYAAEQEKRYGFDPRMRKTVHLIVFAVVVFLFILLCPSPSYNTEFSYTLSGFITALQANVEGISEFLSGATTAPTGLVNYKFCTYLIIFFAGMALAITGAVYQGSLKNALVSPTTLGVSAGGTLGVAIFVLITPVSVLDATGLGSEITATTASAISEYYDSLDSLTYFWVTQGRSLASVIGCLIVVGIVLLVSHLVGRGSSSGYALIICGQVVASLAQAVVEFIRYYVVEHDETGYKSSLIAGTQNGSILEMSTPLDLLFVAVPVIVCTLIVIALRRRLNLLAFSDEEARSMGIATERLRWLIIGVCTIMTAVIISFCGNIAFVGFAIPLIVRRYIGADLTYVLPASALLGGALLMCTYWMTDMQIFTMLGLPSSVNTLTSLIGTVMFIVVTVSQRRANRGADWL